MKTTKKLSIVIACYMDGGAVRHFYHCLKQVLPTITPNSEIIYVNDASPDNAEEILSELAASDSRLVVVNHTRNFGSQNAFLSGMRVAEGDAVVLMDGDLQDPPSLIPALVDKWLQGNQIVYGVRVQRDTTLFRRCCYKLFYRLFRRMAQFQVPVDAGDFGLMDRRVVDILLSDFPERMVLLRGLRAYTGFRHAGVEYKRPARFDGGPSTNTLMRNMRWAKMAIFSFSRKPLEYISILAFWSVVSTTLAAVYYLGAYFHTGRQAPSGFMSLVMLSAFIGSVQLICFSILAEYLGHIYEEIKGRPRFIVRDLIDNRSRQGDRSSSGTSLKCPASSEQIGGQVG